MFPNLIFHFCKIIIVISKKRLEAEKILTKNMEEKKVLEIENVHKKENVNKLDFIANK